MIIGNKKYLMLIGILGLVCVAIGITFGYFRSTISNNNIGGKTLGFDFDMTITPVYNGNLIPVDSSLIDTTMASVSDKCIDSNGNDICSYYEIVVTNGGTTTQSFTGSVITGGGSNRYTTNHLHYKLLDSNYLALSDETALSSTIGDVNLLKQKNSNNDLTLNLPAGDSTFYLVVWLSDVGSNQLEDVNKIYYGTLQFVSMNGAIIKANFTA